MLSLDPKMGTILGVVSGPVERHFDAVFNKTASFTQSLYARARIGIVCSGVIMAKWTPKMDPTDTPWSHR